MLIADQCSISSFESVLTASVPARIAVDQWGKVVLTHVMMFKGCF